MKGEKSSPNECLTGGVNELARVRALAVGLQDRFCSGLETRRVYPPDAGLHPKIRRRNAG